MRILCFGDSNTYGYDPRGFLGGRYDAANRWVDLLANMTGQELINAGSNGREIPQALAETAPADTLLLMLGTNDLLQGASAAEAAARMEHFLLSAIPRYQRVLLVVPPPMVRGTWVPSGNLVAESNRLATEYRAIAQRLGITLIDTGSWKIELAFDGVHFTEAGHHTFAQRLSEYL